jgi:serine/threonine protein kinase
MDTGEFTKQIDFSKYGLNWNIDEETTDIPDSFSKNISQVVMANRKLTITKPSGESLVLNLGTKLGEGTFGKTYKISENIDGKPVVVKIINFNENEHTESSKIETLNDTVKEVFMQILIYEVSKDLEFPEIGLNGPFCASLFYFGKDNYHLYIFMEQMEKNIYDLIRKTPESKLIITTTLQICKICEVLYNTIGFNHRDLKGDNIMYKTINGVKNVRLIDFGFSCVKYRKLEIDVSSELVIHCRSQSRDLHSYLYNLYWYILKYTKSDLKRIIYILMCSDQDMPKSWRNTYSKFNNWESEDSPTRSLNLVPSVLYEILLSIQNKRCNNDTFDADWVLKLVKVYNSQIKYLTDDECKQLNLPDTFFDSYIKDNILKIWMDTNGKDTLIYSFEYHLPTSDYVRERAYMSIDEKKIPEILDNFVEKMELSREMPVDKMGETLFHKICRYPVTQKLSTILIRLLNNSECVQFLAKYNKENLTSFEIAYDSNNEFVLEEIIKRYPVFLCTLKLANLENNRLLNFFKKLPNLTKYLTIRFWKISTGENILHFIVINDKIRNRDDMITSVLNTSVANELITDSSETTSPLVLAFKHKYKFAMESMMQKIYPGAKIESKDILFTFIDIDDYKLFRNVSKYIDLSDKDYKKEDGSTALIQAVKQNKLEHVKVLLDINVKTAIHDNLGKTALHYAAINTSTLSGKNKDNAFDIVRLLVETNPKLPDIKDFSKPAMGPGNPTYSTDPAVRKYIKDRKSGIFTRKKNTNLKKGGRLTRANNVF